MKKAIFDAASALKGSPPYPPPYDAPCKGRTMWMLTKLFGLSQFGISRVELPPGVWSTQRHWHKTNDEAVIVISGELTVVTDDGEQVLGPGDFIAFKMNDPDAHHLQNRGTEPAVYFDIGGRDMYDVSTFPDAGFEAKYRFDLGFRPIEP
ncbi:cupin domain-containing protein [Sphingomonas bacterium]|uniref:cupin domain-containing protein n=1 Tax=Sphingomonas bacterium TaxID=1895847 RepID=UPI0015768E5E|nr:cupin domain-containing protein [Sphingomonas bacterium]